MKKYICYLIKKQIKNKYDIFWLVEMRIQNEPINTSWEIDKYYVNRLIKMVKDLPLYNNGIPKFIEKYSDPVIGIDKDSIIFCYGNFVFTREKNIIEIRSDCDFSIENEILKSAPDNIYKRVCQFL